MEAKAVIFDLDGVVVSTDEYHYQAWQRLADEQEIYFDRQINQRLRGVSRMESLEILLETSTRQYSDQQKEQLADRKNSYYRAFLKNLAADNILPGVMEIIDGLKRRGVKVAIASSSKNAATILRCIGLEDYFDAVVSGNDITASKPDPEVFLIAAERLAVAPENCVVVEDAEAGIEAALAGSMRVIGVGYASADKRATVRASDLASISADDMLNI